MSIWLPAFAQFLGAPAPREITEADALRTAGADSVYLLCYAAARGFERACETETWLRTPQARMAVRDQNRARCRPVVIPV
jgi:hypothetical protein